MGAGVGVRLRAIRESDLAVLYENQRDPVGVAMVGFAPREWDAFLTHRAKVEADPDTVTRAIETADGELAGDIVCFPQDGVREIGYWISRAYWGKGIATAALTAFLDEIEERPLYAHVAVQNGGSRRVLEKCGFTLVGSDDEEHVLVLG